MPGLRYGTAWTALEKSGVSTRPFSPVLPVIDNLALLRMASVNVICSQTHAHTNRMYKKTLIQVQMHTHKQRRKKTQTHSLMLQRESEIQMYI